MARRLMNWTGLLTLRAFTGRPSRGDWEYRLHDPATGWLR
jgi:hypothetical protein